MRYQSIYAQIYQQQQAKKQQLQRAISKRNEARFRSLPKAQQLAIAALISR